jgi:S-adenosylmethionine:tRNA ribosyltransferase-isomerase
MLTSDFDYNLPKQLIAQIPLEPRDSSRLLVVDKKAKKVEDKKFHDIVDYFKKGDLLVWNNTKVFKARLRGSLMLDESVSSATPPKPPLGKRGITPTDRILNVAPVEIFLVRPMENNKVWKALAKPGRKLRLGMKVVFSEDFACEVMLKENDGTFLVQFAEDDMSVRAKANKYGEVPMPPYIRTSDFRLQISADNRPKSEERSLIDQYQTVYAKEEGSVAAPTAGFHFTPELIEKLKAKGVEFAEVTLHVGLGTFLPVKTERLEEHHMHSEWMELTAKNADLINAAKTESRRVVAVGTTTVRVLEGVVKKEGIVRPYSGDINIFIYPGFKFKVVDALITNFHLPKSTLLMLVCAFAGDTKFILDCYEKAVEEKYRFFSFGDAMFIQ